MAYCRRICAIGQFGVVELANQAEERRPVGRSWRDMFGCCQHARGSRIRFDEHIRLQFNHCAVGVGERQPATEGKRRAQHRVVRATDDFQRTVAAIVPARGRRGW